VQLAEVERDPGQAQQHRAGGQAVDVARAAAAQQREREHVEQRAWAARAGAAVSDPAAALQAAAAPLGRAGTELSSVSERCSHQARVYSIRHTNIMQVFTAEHGGRPSSWSTTESLLNWPILL